MSKVEIILVEIVPFSALYYKFHTISILQVRKLVVQVTSTSTSTSYKWRIIGPWFCSSYKYKYSLIDQSHNHSFKKRGSAAGVISHKTLPKLENFKRNYSTPPKQANFTENRTELELFSKKKFFHRKIQISLKNLISDPKPKIIGGWGRSYQIQKPFKKFPIFSYNIFE